ncbi:nuclear transport factor 2 family protein [Mycolicibacterium mucogenicum]|uniref:nuclear transport factor 2 family protein n=1 Tax=Mycolicibacterium mucogenicum TaxID=56689 RepID=UPI002269FE85|nr:nuclear transport factor 2 family protein [Mycolicibacterium mucogenicum]MCX8563028.1 nuclear transport factor 2 family protein [Mycolicibacterium mucogenicum]
MTNATSEQPTAGQVVRHYFDTFFSKDLDKTLQCLTDDVIWQVQGAPDIPTVGTRRGKQEVREWLELFPRHFKPLAFAIHQIFENADAVVVTGHFSHQIIDTTDEFSSDFAALCTVRDGKLARYNFLEDSFGLWKSFQNTPSPIDTPGRRS